MKIYNTAISFAAALAVIACGQGGLQQQRELPKAAPAEQASKAQAVDVAEETNPSGDGVSAETKGLLEKSATEAAKGAGLVDAQTAVNISVGFYAECLQRVGVSWPEISHWANVYMHIDRAWHLPGRARGCLTASSAVWVEFDKVARATGADAGRCLRYRQWLNHLAYPGC